MGNYTWTVNINIYDGKTGELLSQINKNLDYRLKGLSLWGFIGTVGPGEDDIYGIITKMIDTEITRLWTTREKE